jgi:hypothetical protein
MITRSSTKIESLRRWDKVTGRVNRDLAEALKAARAKLPAPREGAKRGL